MSDSDDSDRTGLVSSRLDVRYNDPKLQNRFHKKFGNVRNGIRTRTIFLGAFASLFALLYCFDLLDIFSFDADDWAVISVSFGGVSAAMLGIFVYQFKKETGAVKGDSRDVDKMERARLAAIGTASILGLCVFGIAFLLFGFLLFLRDNESERERLMTISLGVLMIIALGQFGNFIGKMFVTDHTRGNGRKRPRKFGDKWEPTIPNAYDSDGFDAPSFGGGTRRVTGS